AVRVRGGTCVQRPNHCTDYVIVGTFVEPAWAHQGYGRKIEMALELKQHDSRCKIVSEAEWVKALRNSPELPKERQMASLGRPRDLQVEHLQQALDETQKNQNTMLEILLRELKPSDYKRISELFQRCGIIVSTSRQTRQSAKTRRENHRRDAVPAAVRDVS
ncbi:MAG TPA: hypothetical protein VFV81_02350, partial [Verrucomicrobiae bacterium]|nr:hypothetical protein [Verrucomicrobiae bacterium]